MKRLLLCLKIHILPRLGNHLLVRVRPEIGIVEVNYAAHTVFCSSFAYFYGCIDVVAAAAVALAVLVVGVVPYANPYGVHAVFRESEHKVLLLALVVVVDYAAFFLRYNAGNVAAENKVVGKVFDLFDKDTGGSVGNLNACLFVPLARAGCA